MQEQAADNQKTARPKILVLGATGGTGRHIVSQAVTRGYEVAVLVRSPEKARNLKGAEIIVGDARDENVLHDALRHRDAVVSALGTPASPFREVTMLSTVTRSLVNAMKAVQVSRLIAITGIGAGDSKGHGGFLFDNLIYPLLLQKVYADKNRQEVAIRASGLDWTIVRPSILNDKPGGEVIRVLTDLTQFHGGTISREDVAKFIVDQVEDRAWVDAAPLITW